MPQRVHRAIAVFVAVSLLCTAGVPPAGAATPIWTYRSPEEVKWQELTDLGTVLVGTDAGLVCLDPATGTAVWRRDDLKKVSRYQVKEIYGTPVLLVTANTSGNKTVLFAVSTVNGQTIWQTERIKGAAVGVVPVYAKNMVILLTARSSGANKDKPDMIALDMTTGEVKWESELDNKVDLHQADTSGRFFQKFDLSGHQDPIYDQDSIYFTYAGLHRYDLATGQMVWKAPYDVTEGRIKKGNAQAILDGDIIYTSAKGVVRAHDKATGAVKWMSKDFGGAVAEMLLEGDVLYGRMGGHFYEYDKREWVLEKPLGVVALDRKTGSLLWRYDKARDGITNIVYLPDQKVVLFADSKNMVGLDAAGKEAFVVKLEFKNKIGAGAKAARAGMKFARGGLIGLAKKDKQDMDLPVTVELRENGTAVVRGQQHVLAFNPSTRQIPWSVEFPAPGVSGWQLAVMAALTAASYAYHYRRAASTKLGTSENWQANRAKNESMASFQAMFDKRFTATRNGAGYTYLLTKVDDGDDDGPGIVGVNMDTGAPDYQVLLKIKEVDYLVDEVAGRLFNLKDKREISAYALR